MEPEPTEPRSVVFVVLAERLHSMKEEEAQQHEGHGLTASLTNHRAPLEGATFAQKVQPPDVNLGVEMTRSSLHWWSILKPQALACAIIAVWDYIHFRDMQRLLLILALGQADVSLLTSVLFRFLRSLPGDPG